MNRFDDSCERIESMLPAFVAFELNGDDVAVVTAHIESCERCRESFAVLSSLEPVLVARRNEVPAVDAYLPGIQSAKAPARDHRGVLTRCLRVATSVPVMATVLAIWAGLLVARYNNVLVDDISHTTSLERLTGYAKRGLDAMVGAAGGDAWTLTAVYGALAIGVIVSAGALTVRLVRD